eukprot:scaffold591_cov121-Isochrysis_galbana.AAC.5
MASNFVVHQGSDQPPLRSKMVHINSNQPKPKLNGYPDAAARQALALTCKMQVPHITYSMDFPYSHR